MHELATGASLTPPFNKSLPDYIRLRWNDVPAEMWELTDEQLTDELKRLYPTKGTLQLCRRLRIAFWDQMEIAIEKGVVAELDAIYEGICDISYFRRFCRSDPFIPWLLQRPGNFNLRLKELSELTEARIMEILSVSAIRRFSDREGRETEVIDAKLARVQVEIFELVQDRLRGKVAENINQRSVNVTVNGSEGAKKALQAGEKALLTLEEIQKRLKEVQAKRNALNQTSQPAQVVDAKKLMRPDKIEE